MINIPKVFIDSNIPMCATGTEHPNKEISFNFLKKVAEGKIFGITSVEIMQEILYRYCSLNMLLKGMEVFDYFSDIVDEILPVNIHIINNSKDILLKHFSKGILPRDSIYAATMAHYNIKYIATFDKHFELFEDIKNYLNPFLKS